MRGQFSSLVVRVDDTVEDPSGNRRSSRPERKQAQKQTRTETVATNRRGLLLDWGCHSGNTDIDSFDISADFQSAAKYMSVIATLKSVFRLHVSYVFL